MPPSPNGHSMNGEKVGLPSISCNTKATPFAISSALVTGGRLENIGGTSWIRAYDSRMPAMPKVAAKADEIASALRTHGACRIAGFPRRDAVIALRADLQRLQADDALRAAEVGRGEGEPCTPASAAMPRYGWTTCVAVMPRAPTCTISARCAPN